MQKIWKIKEDKKNFNNSLSEKYHPVVLRLLADRGIENEEDIKKYFSPDYNRDLGDPFLISGMEKTITRIIKAKEKKEKICIFGDYDADGVLATVILYEALTNMGIEDVICYIPDRQLEGYGINEKAVNYISQQKVKLIITVDCGITNVQEVEKAEKLEMDVIITDHHHIPEKIPKAHSIINPNLPNSGFVFKYLAGVGVAFKVAQALYLKIAPEKIEQLKWLLDLTAIGTIADCVPLLEENRALVKYGLIVLSKTKRAGLLEMFKVGRIDISENSIPDAHKVAFQVSPRINAAGRMDHANTAYELLIEKNRTRARNLALELEDKNSERQKVTTEIFREVKILAENSFKEKKIIFAESPHWPVGVLGLVAGKIMEEFQKPAGIFQKKDNGEHVGSFRSIPEVNIMEILEECSEFLIKFGGHSQAAGVSVAQDKMEEFYKKIIRLIDEKIARRKILPFLEIDCEIGADDLDWELAENLKKMEPFGAGNQEPVFCAKNMIVNDAKIVGNGHKHLKLMLRFESGGPKIFDAIGFSLAEKFPQIKKNDKIDAVFNIREDEWNGNRKTQLNIIDLRFSK